VNVIVMLADELFHDPLRPGGQLTSSPILLQLQDGEGTIWLRPEAALGISNALFRQAEEYEMDLWAVKYASRRSSIGDFWGDSSVRGARMRGVLASHANAGQRDLSAQEAGPDGMGVGGGSAQFESIEGGRCSGAVPGRTSGGDDLQGATALEALLDVNLEH
jgi:hypothetical protein